MAAWVAGLLAIAWTGAQADPRWVATAAAGSTAAFPEAGMAWVVRLISFEVVLVRATLHRRTGRQAWLRAGMTALIATAYFGWLLALLTLLGPDLIGPACHHAGEASQGEHHHR